MTFLSIKSPIDAFLDNPTSRIARARLWLWITLYDACEWLERFIYAQHNARVIMDFEDRMTSVIYAATGGMMSKPYYETDIMIGMIESHHEHIYDEGYNAGEANQAERQT